MNPDSAPRSPCDELFCVAGAAFAGPAALSDGPGDAEALGPLPKSPPKKSPSLPFPAPALRSAGRCRRAPLPGPIRPRIFGATGLAGAAGAAAPAPAAGCAAARGRGGCAPAVDKYASVLPEEDAA